MIAAADAKDLADRITITSNIVDAVVAALLAYSHFVASVGLALPLREYYRLGTVGMTLLVAADCLILLQLGGVNNCFVTLRIAAVSHVATMDPDQPERQGEHPDD